MPSGTLAGLLADAAAAVPGRPALIEATRTTSFAALDNLARRVATGLAALGIGIGDPVALWLPNTPAHYALTFAIWRVGATVVGVNTRFRAKEVEDIVGRTGAKALVYWSWSSPTTPTAHRTCRDACWAVRSLAFPDWRMLHRWWKITGRQIGRRRYSRLPAPRPRQNLSCMLMRRCVNTPNGLQHTGRPMQRTRCSFKRHRSAAPSGW